MDGLSDTELDQVNGGGAGADIDNFLKLGLRCPQLRGKGLIQHSRQWRALWQWVHDLFRHKLFPFNINDLNVCTGGVYLLRHHSGTTEFCLPVWENLDKLWRFWGRGLRFFWANDHAPTPRKSPSANCAHPASAIYCGIIATKVDAG